MTAIPTPGEALPRRGNAALAACGRLALRLLGWRIEGAVPDLPKLVIAVAPHTSNWDFVVGMAAMFALDLRLSFLGKHTIFRGPFDAPLRWMGGIPVDRAKAHGVVAECVRAFATSDRRLLAIAPQGTRKGPGRFRGGFLYIARGAGVPVLLAALDYGARRVRVGPLVQPSADVAADLARIEAHFAAVQGRRARAAETEPEAPKRPL
ncbi:MAG TPA: lysophospholipid acyltransferase family protein [Usitatibacter sp.]|nr:lysophospholipid acyltransferase family protein [Usitatibacter sp.]